MAQASSSQLQSVQGVWQPVTSPSTTSLGSATIVDGKHIVVELPYPPVSASTRSPHALQTSLPEHEVAYDAVDAFFGVTRSDRVGGTRCSRHDDVPPPYPHIHDLPAYDEATGAREHPTLAMYLFKYGFLFPLFWFIGCFVLITPLRAPEDWEPTKTMEERAELVASMRKTEVKWARRCLMAAATFLVFVVALALTIWKVLKD